MSKKSNKNITRKEALKKMGRYAALTSLGTFMILNPKKAQAQSPLTQVITRLATKKYKPITKLYYNPTIFSWVVC